MSLRRFLPHDITFNIVPELFAQRKLPRCSLAVLDKRERERERERERGGGIKTAVHKTYVSFLLSLLFFFIIKTGGKDLITALTTIRNKIWQTEEWPTP